MPKSLLIFTIQESTTDYRGCTFLVHQYHYHNKKKQGKCQDVSSGGFGKGCDWIASRVAWKHLFAHIWDRIEFKVFEVVWGGGEKRLKYVWYILISLAEFIQNINYYFLAGNLRVGDEEEIQGVRREDEEKQKRRRQRRQE